MRTATDQGSELDCYREPRGIVLNDYTGLGAPYQWCVCQRAQTVYSKYPHCKAVSSQNIDVGEDEDLKRSEVIPILVIMRWRMGLYAYQQHEAFPVRLCHCIFALVQVHANRGGQIQILSIFDNKARFLIAYHDGKHLCIQKSPLYGIEGDSAGPDENAKLLQRWWLADAAGDTSRVPS